MVMKVEALLDVDLVALESQDTVTVLLDLVAPEVGDQEERPEGAVIVVLDRSGSMSGGRLENAKRALLELVGRLDEKDSFGLVTFDHAAQVVVPAGTVGDLGKQAIRSAISDVRTGGSTDLSSGFLRGLQEAQRVSAAGGTTVIVLSDGMANSGITDPAQFRSLAEKAASDSISTSTIGIGEGYDDRILSELALGGGGNHVFAVDGDSAAAAVSTEVDGLLSKSILAASLLVKPSSQVSSVGVMNDLPVQAVPDGVLLELGDFYSGEQRRVLVKIEVPAMAALGLAEVAVCEFNFVALPDLKSQKIRVPVSVNVVPQDVAEGRVPQPVVEQEKLLITVQKAKRKAEEALRSGDREEARGRLNSARGAMRASQATSASDDIASELDEVSQTLAHLDERSDAFSSKRLNESRTMRSRGMYSRYNARRSTDPGSFGDPGSHRPGSSGRTVGSRRTGPTRRRRSGDTPTSSEDA